MTALSAAKRTCFYTSFSTAIGSCGLAWTEAGILGIQLPERTEAGTRKRLQEKLGIPLQKSSPPPRLVPTIKAITAHLEGRPQSFSQAELDLSGISPFFRKVYLAAREIEAGKTVSYGQLAHKAGSPAAARAVGQAMARNPFPIIVPCHRIIGSDGKPVGFSAFGGCFLKEKLLLLEQSDIKNTKNKSGRSRSGTVAKQKNSGIVSSASSGQKLSSISASQAVAAVRFAPGQPGKYMFDPEEAIGYLSRKDRLLGKLINKVGDFRLEIDEMLTPFEALAESIVYQQLTGKAAATIFSRVKALYGSERLPEARKIIKTPDEFLRGAGLSTAKTLAFKDLADRQHRGLIPSLADLQLMSDDEIVEQLVMVRGIGRWTAEMLLIFRLGRPDVLPIHDYGVRKGYAVTIGRGGELPTPKELESYGERWRPFRSVASWYLWRALELPENKKKTKAG